MEISNGSIQLAESLDIHSVILYSLTIFCSVFQIVVSSFVLFVLIQSQTHSREFRIDYYLYATTYSSLVVVACFFVDMSIYSIYGRVYRTVSFDNFWCRIKSFIMYGSGYLFFHSFFHQSFYRFTRIFHSNVPILKSLRFHVGFSIVILILIHSELILSYLLGDMSYLVREYHCQFLFTNLLGSIRLCTFGFFIPFMLTWFFYLWTLIRIRRQTSTLFTINRAHVIRRDVLVIKRLVFLLTFVTMVAAPHIIFPTIYALTGLALSWFIAFQWFLTSFALFLVSMIFVYVSSNLKRVFIEKIDFKK